MTGNKVGDLKIGLMNKDFDSSNGLIMKMINRGNRDKKYYFIWVITFYDNSWSYYI